MDSDLAFRAELEELAAERGIRLVYLLGRRARPDSWLSADLGHLRDGEAPLRLVPDIAAHDVFLCAPDPWMDAATRAARDAGVPVAQIHAERFTW